MTLFIYFSLIGEIILFIGALIMLFTPLKIFSYLAIFFFISEFPILIAKQIVIIISDTGGVTYTTFGVPSLFLTPLLWFFAVFTFGSIENVLNMEGKSLLPKRLR